MIPAKTARRGHTPSSRREQESGGCNDLRRKPRTSVYPAFAGVATALGEVTALTLRFHREFHGIRPR